MLFFQNILQVGEQLQLHIAKASKTFILTDSHVADSVLPNVLGALENPDAIDIIELEPGESAKNIEIAHQLWQHLAEAEADRHALFINLGGGVITDLGGFVASTYKRGIPFIHIPTSLMAMTDAAIGGKTGIDLEHIKNAVGTFALPIETYICPAFLDTLPENELLSGFAEMIKHGIIADETLFQTLELIDLDQLHTLSLFVERSAQIKEQIVAEDPNEKGKRKLLNFGHTVGHAIESVTLNRQHHISHGHAVALGMLVEAQIAHDLNLLASSDQSRISALITKFFTLDQAITFEELLPYLKQDKKNIHGEIRMALPLNIGQANWDIHVAQAQLQKSWNALFNG
ncbi:MAG: 3-dehydroquinate synthase [Flavobacteriales bacterium]